MRRRYNQFQLREQNKARQDIGLPKLVPEKRVCPDCGKEFEGLGHRYCGCVRKEEISNQVKSWAHSPHL